MTLPDRQRPRFEHGLIYAILNTMTGRRYIGATTSMSARERFAQHISQLRRGIHSNASLQSDASALGVEAFTLEVLAFDVPEEPGKRIYAHERVWIARYQAEPAGIYNRSGVTQSTISNLEKGRPARFVTMRSLAKALGVETAALVGEEPNA